MAEQKTENKAAEVPKKKGIGYTDAELAKMPKEEREKILQGRRDRENALKAMAKRDLDSPATEISDRQYNGKFKTACKNIRQTMQILNAKKQLGELTGKALYDKFVEKVKENL